MDFETFKVKVEEENGINGTTNSARLVVRIMGRKDSVLKITDTEAKKESRLPREEKEPAIVPDFNFGL